ncbi:dolichol-phosphate mannosyltransferase subunit 3 [Cantharellus anzutake]|uniref:dolichol-phosphate mannosyltransferase subunit 3 n=1 Tax=Cantharellus anzutake TaxID=1750568 RepID=UPI00190342FC|nr:dolichol-phosphate mannosyltransferase subunit 3 [Cantharellus anzutake]KAF8342304.1 dolichol-phosphate mannosyltransferase subunit 3 [Cantharellus anzutake]
MTRAHRFTILATIFTFIYALTCLSIIPLPLVSKEVAHQLIPVLPWWLLVSFGAYSLATLGWGLWTFKDCPDAYEELMREISLAKNELRSKGVSVD